MRLLPNSFGDPPFHLVGLSGGKDSTALALMLQERNPEIDYIFYCTPTGDELPEMLDWWKRLGEMLGKPVLPIMETTLNECIKKNGTLPNFRMRFCTRQIKIEPILHLMRTLAQFGQVHSYIGLRADEPGRAGGAFDSVPGVTVHFPLREWSWTIRDVWKFLEARHILIPGRTDCALCFHQRIGEWWRLWHDYPERYAHGVALEQRYGATLRTPGRDSWPTSLADIALEFAKGKIPKGASQIELLPRTTMNSGTCRICSL